MLVNAIVFVTLIPFEFVIMKWLSKELIKAFKEFSE